MQIGQNWWHEALLCWPWLSQCETNDFRNPETIKEIEFIIVPLQQISEARCFRWWLYQTFRKWILHNLLQKTAEEETCPSSSYEATKLEAIKKKSHTTISLINIDVKIPNKSVSNYNTAMYKRHYILQHLGCILGARLD